MSKTKSIFQNAFDCGTKRANKQVSQIKEIKDIAEKIKKEQGTREIEMEIHQLLQNAKTLVQQEKILKAYIDGLNRVDEQDRLKYEIVWSKKKEDFEGSNIWKVLLDRENNQIMVTTFSEKPRNVYCFDLKIGKRNWVYKIRYEQACTPFLDKDIFFFIPIKNSESHSWSGDYVHAISSKTGELLWKLKAGRNAEEILGLFDDSLLVYGWLADESGHSGVMALDVANGNEIWSCVCYGREHNSYLQVDDFAFLKIGERKIAWFSKDGKLLKEKTFGFRGFENGAFIDLIEQDENNLYVFVWSLGSRHAINPKDRNKAKDILVIYCLDKNKKTLKWQVKIPEMRVEKMISQNSKLYMFSKEERLIILDKEKGKIIDELDYQGKAISQNLLFCTGSEDKDNDYSFDFFAIDLSSKKTKWQRRNFKFHALYKDLLYGQVEKDLIILDQNNGRERAKIKMDGEIREIQFINNEHLLVHGRNFIHLIKQK